MIYIVKQNVTSEKICMIMHNIVKHILPFKTSIASYL